jgi:hypothetical protein
MKISTKSFLNNTNLKIEKNELKIKDWEFHSKKTPMLSQQKMENVEKTLGVFLLPEMVFESDLVFENKKTGFKLEFNSIDALKGATKEILKNCELVKDVKVSHSWEK